MSAKLLNVKCFITSSKIYKVTYHIPVSLPYYRDQLPGPLPEQEIDEATTILPTNNKNFGGRLVVSLLGQLQSIFQDMRSLPSPRFYGSVTKGPIPHRYFFSRDIDSAITGPF